MLIVHGGDGTVNEVVNGIRSALVPAAGGPAVGVVPGGSTLNLNHLDPKTGKWSASPIAGGMALPMIGGNDGTVSAFDGAAGHLYVLLGTPPPNPNADFVRHLARIDLRGGADGGPALGTHPVLGAIGPMKACADCLMQLCM